MIENCPHPNGYRKVLQTEHYILEVIRCVICGEFIRVQTDKKNNH